MSTIFYRAVERILAAFDKGIGETQTCIQRLSDAHSALILKQLSSLWNSGGGKIIICVTHRTDRAHCVVYVGAFKPKMEPV